MAFGEGVRWVLREAVKPVCGRMRRVWFVVGGVVD